MNREEFEHAVRAAGAEMVGAVGDFGTGEIG